MTEAKRKIVATTSTVFFILPSFWHGLLSLQANHGMPGIEKTFIHGTSTERNKRRTISGSARPCCMMRKENGLRQYEDNAIYMRWTDFDNYRL